jgi:hypothetical protein
VLYYLRQQPQRHNTMQHLTQASAIVAVLHSAPASAYTTRLTATCATYPAAQVQAADAALASLTPAQLTAFAEADPTAPYQGPTTPGLQTASAILDAVFG